MSDIVSTSRHRFECPHCQGTGGFKRVLRMSGITEYFYEWDGTDGCNGGMHDCLTYKENKTAHCVDCGKVVKNWKEIMCGECGYFDKCPVDEMPTGVVCQQIIDDRICDMEKFDES